MGLERERTSYYVLKHTKNIIDKHSTAKYTPPTSGTKVADIELSHALESFRTVFSFFYFKNLHHRENNELSFTFNINPLSNYIVI